MDELATPSRIHHFLVVGLLLESEDVLREKLERAGEIGFKRAD